MYKGFYSFLAINFLWYIMHRGHILQFSNNIVFEDFFFWKQYMPDKLLILKYLNGSSLSVILSRNN